MNVSILVIYFIVYWPNRHDYRDFRHNYDLIYDQEVEDRPLGSLFISNSQSFINENKHESSGEPRKATTRKNSPDRQYILKIISREDEKEARDSHVRPVLSMRHTSSFNINM